MIRAPIIDFEAPPATGTVIPYFKGRTLTLIRAVPYERLDGSFGHLLEWRSDDGLIGCSGLRSNGVTWGSLDGALEKIAESRTLRNERGIE